MTIEWKAIRDADDFSHAMPKIHDVANSTQHLRGGNKECRKTRPAEEEADYCDGPHE